MQSILCSLVNKNIIVNNYHEAPGVIIKSDSIKDKIIDDDDDIIIDIDYQSYLVDRDIQLIKKYNGNHLVYNLGYFKMLYFIVNLLFIINTSINPSGFFTESLLSVVLLFGINRNILSPSALSVTA